MIEQADPLLGNDVAPFMDKVSSKIWNRL